MPEEQNNTPENGGEANQRNETGLHKGEQGTGTATAPQSFPPDPIIDETEYGEVEEKRGRSEMGFFEHLEELRWHIIKSVIAIVVCTILCAVFAEFLIVDVLLGPATRLGVELQNFEPMGQITLLLQVCLFSGIILSIPFILWQFWQFIKPGLYPKERKYTSVITVATIFCFLAGISFAYFIMVPTSLGFAQGFQFGTIRNDFAINSYFSFVLGFMLACGAVFEMPMISYALSRFGIVTPAFMKKYRRHAIVVILIVAAVITPTPDPINQLMLAVPLYALYELSIIISSFAKRQRSDAMEETAEGAGRE